MLQFFFFNIRGSVHRNSRLKKSNEMQQYADFDILLTVHLNIILVINQFDAKILVL